MGMFDSITYEAPCPMCGESLTRWQSKSGGCALDNLTPRELWKQRDNPYYRDQLDDPGMNFYANCEQCGTWVEIHISDGVLPFTNEDFDRHRAGETLKRRRGPILSDPRDSLEL